ncbi:4'-phosphopantetheinyl transferase family protein [Hazenella coriacea]|uniref:Phosphopantetheine--protein transferase-like protein n=1 Tax=Hazenella coriacea TaxID=1179467 RepID=A0A4V2UUX3_9BACL|nr:4'-phosphopantetheinyl transferase superfamily protein [Hazenella coriacea]TCS93457.1 phosphopantetheine--protein transferase-like protein [Hazenella coriacea]
MIRRKQIQIYWLPIPATFKVEDLQIYDKLLDPQEKDIYQRYQVDFKKIEFVLGRALLKTQIGKALQIAPEDVRFYKNKYGKLYLDARSVRDQSLIYFNLSHTDGMVVCSLSQVAEVGIDVEKIKENDLEAMKLVFTPPECEFVRSQKIEDQLRSFYLLWTRKEGVMKAEGKGFSLPPQSFQVPTNLGRCESESYVYHTFQPTGEYMISVVVRNGNEDLMFQENQLSVQTLKSICCQC